ncbi:16716_t:CDS:1, partial [Cetraspora pellucida]
PELPLKKDLNISHKSAFKMISIDDVANYDRIEMPIVKYAHGCPQNNKRICSKNEDKTSKKVTVRQKSDDDSIYSNLHISQDMILQVHNPISDSHYGFRSLAIAFFKDEKRWQNVKVTIKGQLTKKKQLYNNILGYNINQLIVVLSYIEPVCLQEFWFYSPECAQLASNTFNMPVVVF